MSRLIQWCNQVFFAEVPSGWHVPGLSPFGSFLVVVLEKPRGAARP